MASCPNCGRQTGAEKFCADCGTAIPPISSSDGAVEHAASAGPEVDYSPYRLPPAYGPSQSPPGMVDPETRNAPAGGHRNAGTPTRAGAATSPGAAPPAADGAPQRPAQATPIPTPATDPSLVASPTPTAPRRHRTLIAVVVAALLATATAAAVITIALQPEDTAVPTAEVTSGVDSTDRPEVARTTTTPTRTRTPEPTPEPTVLTAEGALLLAPTEAVRTLNELVATDRSTVAQFTGYWVPQVSSKCVGLRVDLEPDFVPDGNAETASVTAAQILAFHIAMSDRYGVMVTTAADLGSATLPPVCTANALWVSLVPTEFSSADGALSWCRQRAIPRDECAARFLAPPGQDTKVELQPG